MSNLPATRVPELATGVGSKKVRHRRPTAHARTRYRCFLPDLAGLAGRRRVEPMPDLSNSNILHGRAPASNELFSEDVLQRSPPEVTFDYFASHIAFPSICWTPRIDADMPAPLEKTVGTHESTKLDRYLLVCVYLMLIAGFGTVAATGQLDRLSVVGVTAALLWRGFLLLTHRTVALQERWNTRFALSFVLFYFTDVLLLSRSFLTATVHLVLLGMVVKIFSPLRDRDYVLLALLSFAMVLAASVLTVDSSFFVTFSLFLLMSVGAFVLLQMHRAAAVATRRVEIPPSSANEHRLALSLGVTIPTILVLILGGAAGIFFVLPRVSAGYAGTFSSGNDISTGFSNEVRLGRIGEIQQSDAAIMHVQIQGATSGFQEFKWRGVALDSFDGATWSNHSTQILAPQAPGGRYLVAPEMPPRRDNILRYRVLLEPLSSNVFFLAEQPLTLQGNYGMVAFDAGGAVYDLDREHSITVYEAESAVPQLSATAALDKADGTIYPPEIPRIYLQLPDLDPRIVTLAHEITTGAKNDHQKAAALEQHLRTHYGYTLQLPSALPKDPLANFLFARKQGHCEYFSSAMAVMLRSIGIPSRVVNGFRGGEFNDLTGKYLIRAKDAHSWVEAYFPGEGWISFDPTPAASVSDSGGSRLALYMDAMSSFWREWIVNYDFAHQHSLGEDGIRTARTWMARLRQNITKPYARLLHSAHFVQDGANGRLLTGMRLGMGLGCLLLVLGNVRRLRRCFTEASWSHSPGRAPRQAASIWYERMIKALGRRGWSKAPGQTPLEFVEQISDVQVRESVERFTRHYERARFAGSIEDAQRLPELFEEISATSH